MFDAFTIGMLLIMGIGAGLLLMSFILEKKIKNTNHPSLPTMAFDNKSKGL